MASDPGKLSDARAARSVWPRRIVWLAAALVLGSALALAPVRPALLQLVAWLQTAGWVGPAAFAAVYVLASICFLPVWILTAGAGFLWGPWWGLALVSPAGLVGALALFGLARRLGRARVRRALGARALARVGAMEALLRARGWRAVVALRLSPVFPFGLVNATLGLSGLPARTFAWATWLGMLPGLLIYLYFGTLARDVQQLMGGGAAAVHTLHPALAVVGGLVVLAVTLAVVRAVARAVRIPEG